MTRRTRLACGLAGLLFLAYNANGREVGTFDTQPQKFTARELAARGTLRLDRIIEERPGLAERTAFARDAGGHWRSAYPVLPGVIAALPAAALHWTGLVDLDAPLAPNLVAKLVASALTAAAVALLFLATASLVPERVAWWTALGLGLGTGYWPVLAQSLWQHGPAALGLALCVYAWMRPPDSLRRRDLLIGGIGVGLAGAARPALGPAVAVLVAWILVHAGPRRAVPALAPIAAFAFASIVTNLLWFGDPLGAYRVVESVHPTVHAVPGAFAERPWANAAGLLVSPSRGLLIYSPIVLMALAGLAAAWRDHRAAGLPWITAAAAVQFVAYACYAVWWGGHSFGPRYLLDVLPLVVPLAALGVARISRFRPAVATMAVLLAWSVAVAAAGAFVHPNDRWNTDPADVDRHHERLWDWRDPQVLRVFRMSPSPQNFDLLTREAVRAPAGEAAAGSE